MNMLLRDVTQIDLTKIFRRNRKRSPAPHLLDPAAVRRARRLAKAQGIWDEITAHMRGGKVIPALKRSDYRAFKRTGNRRVYEVPRNARSQAVFNAYLALWLNHPEADADYLQDLLWAWCDEWTWVMSAHEGRATDLGSNMLAAWLSEILHVVGDRLENEVTDRVRRNIEERIFRNVWDYKAPEFWKTIPMNWNHVCNGDYIRAALYLEDDPAVLAHMVHGALNNMTYALDGFTDDGGCEEGPGYWGYGFGHYLMAAYALYCKSDGKINIMKGGKIERICRYPLAAHLDNGWFAPFADCKARWVSPLNTILINKFYDIPELFSLCRPLGKKKLTLAEDRTGKRGNVKLNGTHDLTLYEGQIPGGFTDNADYALPDLGQVKIKSPAGKGQLTLAALASHNGVPHSHNDVGTFVIARSGELWLTDPGAPLYRKEVFRADTRYTILHCRTRGHSVPVINGHEQRFGSRYRGTLKTENLNGDGDRKAVITMTRAYPKGTVKKLTRTFTVSGTDASVIMEDAYSFERKPRRVEEAFITLHKAVVAKNGMSVRIGPAGKGVTVRAAGMKGRFRAERLVEESKDGNGDDVVTRITFIPSQPAKEMRLRFEIR